MDEYIKDPVFEKVLKTLEEIRTSNHDAFSEELFTLKEVLFCLESTFEDEIKDPDFVCKVYLFIGKLADRGAFKTLLREGLRKMIENLKKNCNRD